MANVYSAGIATAYGAAVRGGYTGTYEEFCAQQAQYAENARAVETAKTEAHTSAENAAVSETNAATSETNAGISETNAGSSASSAFASANRAALSETNAAASATNAASSETNAAASATNAGVSAGNALASANNAALSETNAAASATNAATSETNAAASETNAATSETNAGISETNAATSEENAANSAIDAANSAADAAGVVLVQDTEPEVNGNKVWFDSGSLEQTSVPTVSEFNELSEQVENQNGSITLQNIQFTLTTDDIPDTVRSVAYDNSGNVTQIIHERNGTAIRTDIFTFGESTITEIRTLNTGDKLTIATNTATLVTTITFDAA